MYHRSFSTLLEKLQWDAKKKTKTKLKANNERKEGEKTVAVTHKTAIVYLVRQLSHSSSVLVRLFFFFCWLLSFFFTFSPLDRTKYIIKFGRIKGTLLLSARTHTHSDAQATHSKWFDGILPVYRSVPLMLYFVANKRTFNFRLFFLFFAAFLLHTLDRCLSISLVLCARIHNLHLCDETSKIWRTMMAIWNATVFKQCACVCVCTIVFLSFLSRCHHCHVIVELLLLLFHFGFVRCYCGRFFFCF